ncbi:MAG: iron hydrogenase small subunit [Clostridia bacterium]|nr:iron hydrogenase small subunit [Clostridia bacterium]
MENMVNVKINGIDVSVPAGSTILEAARIAHIDIPTLCYLKDLNQIGACRLCLVEVKGARGLMTACVTTVNEGMEIFTNTEKVRKYRKMNLKLVLSTHEKKCLSCIRNQKCELQQLCSEMGVEDEEAYKGRTIKYELDESSPSLVRDNNKCIVCRRCVAACNAQGIGVINSLDRGFDTHIASPFDQPLAAQACVNCGQCVVACPVGALYEKDDTAKVFEALSDPTKHVAICMAPSIRATIGECFGFEPGVDTEGKLVAAAKRLGFDGVYDMNLTADLTIMEEATEFLGRVKNGGTLPMMTSCSPGWIKFCEHYFPEFTDNLSTCKSPQQMFGAMYKTYYARKAGLDPADIVFVSAIPCTAKKFECRRPDQSAVGNGIYDVDYAITTRELARMIERAGIDYRKLDDEKYDAPFDIGSGAGAIFGATGGVMEAALRMAAEVILGTKLEKESLDFMEVRGTEPIKFATYKLGDMSVRVAVVSGTGNAKELLNKVKSGEVEVDFIEVMCCPGGCVNGGGQPVQTAKTKAEIDLKKARASILYTADKNLEYRKSQDNPAVLKIYEEYLGEPGSHLAHEILHTSYIKRGLYN